MKNDSLKILFWMACLACFGFACSSVTPPSSEMNTEPFQYTDKNNQSTDKNALQEVSVVEEKKAIEEENTKEKSSSTENPPTDGSQASSMIYVVGKLINSETKKGFNSVQIQVQNCPACPVLSTTSQTIQNEEGIFQFQSAGIQPTIVPSDGALAVRFEFSFAGVKTLVLFKKPDYKLVSGKTVFNLGDIYLERSNAVDTDGDGLSDAYEKVLGLDPNNADSDRDGIPDGWEVYGNKWLDYSSFGASPKRKDILVEVDYHEYVKDGKTYSAKLSEAIIQKLQSFFGSLPIQTDFPDGSSTKGIHIYIHHDSKLPESHNCYTGGGGAGGDNSPSHPLFAQSFHKAMICIGDHVRGHSPIGGRSLKFRTPNTNNDPSDDWDEENQFLRYATFVHEIGHSLGLLHGGNENMNYKPNYPSVMNYAYDISLYGGKKSLRETQIQYSAGLLPDIDENNVQEVNPFPGLSVQELGFLENYQNGQGGNYQVKTCTHDASLVCVDWNKNKMLDMNPYSRQLRVGKDVGTGFKVLKDVDDFKIIKNKMAKVLPCNPNP